MPIVLIKPGLAAWVSTLSRHSPYYLFLDLFSIQNLYWTKELGERPNKDLVTNIEF
jgi:hypothetical protein